MISRGNEGERKEILVFFCLSVSHQIVQWLSKLSAALFIILSQSWDVHNGLTRRRKNRVTTWHSV